ncbi:MAG: transposase [Draconibacterium sp.]
MLKRRYKKSEIHKILKEYEDGKTIADILKEYGISQATFYNWKSKYGNSSSNDISKLNKLKEENDRLKRMYAELSLENQWLKGQLEGKE